MSPAPCWRCSSPRWRPSPFPPRFQLIIDRGFTGSGGDIGRWFQYLLLIVVVMAIATAARFYFVSWLGERVVADVREAVQRNLLRLAPAFFEENRPSEIASRLTADTTIIEQVVGTTISVALRNIVMGHRRDRLSARAGAEADRDAAARHPDRDPSDRLPRPADPQRLALRARTGSPMSARWSTRCSGAMKIVQAFGQEAREASRFAEAVERVFDDGAAPDRAAGADDGDRDRARSSARSRW